MSDNQGKSPAGQEICVEEFFEPSLFLSSPEGGAFSLSQEEILLGPMETAAVNTSQQPTGAADEESVPPAPAPTPTEEAGHRIGESAPGKEEAASPGGIELPTSMGVSSPLRDGVSEERGTAWGDGDRQRAGSTAQPKVPAHVDMAESFEALIEEVGSFNRFQFLLIPAALSIVFTSVWSMMFMVFGALEPDWWCTSRDVLLNQSIGPDLEHHDVLNNMSYKYCPKGEGGIKSCESLVFATDTSTIVSQFQLVCDRAWMSPMTISVQMTGVLLGAVIGGFLADRFGRRMVVICLASVHTIFNLVAAFSVTWLMFIIFRVLLGLATGGILTNVSTYPTEFIGSRYRGVVASFPTWALAAVAFSFLLWVLKDWSHIHLATAATTAICVMLYIFFLPESVRWLLTKGRVEEAQRVLEQIAGWNGRMAPKVSTMAALQPDRRGQRRGYNYLHLFSTRTMLKVSVLQGFVWFSSSLAYYGISFGIKDLAGDFYLNYLLMSLLEIPATMSVYHLTKWFGRRWTCFFSQLLVALCCLTVIPVTLLVQEDVAETCIRWLSMAARMTLYLSWNAMALHVRELFPTVLRAMGIGFCDMASRTAGILAPFISSLGEMYVFYVVTGVFMAVSCVLPLMLRETRDQPLRDEITVRGPNVQLASDDQKA